MWTKLKRRTPLLLSAVGACLLVVLAPSSSWAQASTQQIGGGPWQQPDPVTYGTSSSTGGQWTSHGLPTSDGTTLSVVMGHRATAGTANPKVSQLRCGTAAGPEVRYTTATTFTLTIPVASCPEGATLAQWTRVNTAGYALRNEFPGLAYGSTPAPSPTSSSAAPTSPPTSSPTTSPSPDASGPSSSSGSPSGSGSASSSSSAPVASPSPSSSSPEPSPSSSAPPAADGGPSAAAFDSLARVVEFGLALIVFLLAAIFVGTWWKP